MSRAVTFLLALAASLVLACAGAAQPLGALARLLPEDTRSLEEAGGRLTVTLGLSQPVPFRVFALDDPWRVVLDVREVVWDAIPDDFGAAPGIRAVEAGAAPDPGWSRMVLTLDRPMLPRTAAMETRGAKGRAVVRLVLAPVSAEAFAAGAGLPPGLTARA
ncbi:MAG: AMIN domain-containing protein, partial [Roseicyclus sp.]